MTTVDRLREYARLRRQQRGLDVESIHTLNNVELRLADVEALLGVVEAGRDLASFDPSIYETEADAGFVFQGLLGILKGKLEALDSLEER